MCGWVRGVFCGELSRRSRRWWMLACRADEQCAVGRSTGDARAGGFHRLYRGARAVLGSRTGRMLGTVFAVVAVLALALALFWAHGGSGITFGRIVAAWEHAENVHMTAVSASTGSLAYEIWISSDMNLLAMNRVRDFIVYDLNARQKRCTDLTSGQTEFTPLSDLEYAGVERMATLYPGPLLINAPSDAKWRRIADRGDQEIYEFTQTGQSSSGRDYRMRFEVAIDARTRLPQTLLLFHGSCMTGGWECMSQITFEYPTGPRMKCLIQNAIDTLRPCEIDRPAHADRI